jgi:hypothetical protein
MTEEKNPNLRDGDLETLTVVEHDSIIKKFAIMGQFKGSDDEIILARIGEGPDDPRSEDIVRLTAESVAEEITGLYGRMAALRHYNERSDRASVSAALKKPSLKAGKAKTR